jgi:septal ring factor EnvC (AmiA/AmiB activator)
MCEPQVKALQEQLADLEAEHSTLSTKLFTSTTELNEAKRRLVGPLLLLLR